jgi:hypothetical protein
LNKEVQRIPISSVVLSSQQVEVKDALYNAMKTKDQSKEEAVNPLLENGKKLIPSVTRVFNRQRDLYIYLQAYEPDDVSVQPLVAFVSFYRAQKKAFETVPVAIKDAWKNRLKTMPVQFDIPLNGLAPGTYDCQVSVLDPNGQKAAFWQAPVVVQ